MFQVDYYPDTTRYHKLLVKTGSDDICDDLPIVKSTLHEGNWIHCLSDLHGPWGVAVNRTNIVISEYYGDCVSVYNERGVKLTSFGSRGAGIGQMDSPCGITISPSDQIIVADSGNHRIQMFTMKGQFVQTVGRKGTGPLEFDYPVDIAVHPVTKKLYVSDSYNYRVHILNDDYTIDTILSIDAEATEQQKMMPWGLAFTHNYHLLVVDSNNRCVQEFSKDNSYLGQLIKQEAGGITEPRCIAIHEQSVFITDASKNCILEFDMDGKFQKTIGKTGISKGDFQNPYGLAIDSNGLLYNCDFTNNRVQIL